MKILMKAFAADENRILLREHVYNRPESDAKALIAKGAAVPYDGPKPAVKVPLTPDPEDATTAEPGWSDEE
jgi:hypothetical protein